MQNLEDNLLKDLLPILSDPESLIKTLTSSSNKNPNSDRSIEQNWHGSALVCGAPSLILFYSTLERIGANTGSILHKYIFILKETVESSGLGNLSLYNGLAGMAFAVREASFVDSRYQTLLGSLDQHFGKGVKDMYLSPIHKHIKSNEPVPFSLYDITLGVSGIGRYLLEDLQNPSFHHLSKQICLALVSLSRPKKIRGKIIPGWYVSEKSPLNKELQAVDPNGNFNLGLAHGIAGVLAYLSIALIKGLEVPGQREAIERISSWIIDRAQGTNDTKRWSYSTSWEEEVEGQKRQEQFSQEGWCYGVPGVSRSIYLAGKALHNQDLCLFAKTAFSGIFTRKRNCGV